MHNAATMRQLLPLSLVLILASACAESPAPAARAVPPEGLVITNARILVGDGTAIDSGAVVVRDGIIVSASADTPDVPGALVIDAGGRTVMPGFVDAHRHVISGNAQEWLAGAGDRMREFLEAGFTTVLSAGDDEDAILELRRRLTEGELAGPRLIAAGRAPLAGPAAGGGPRPPGDPARTDTQRDPSKRPTASAIPTEQTRARIQEIKARGFDAVKTVMIVTPRGPERQTLAVVVDEAKRAGIPVITHATSVLDTLAAVEAGTTVLVHTPHHDLLTEEQARTIAASGIPMMSTLGVFVPFYDEDNTPIFRDAMPFPWTTLPSAGNGPVNARLVWEAGVPYAFGTDTSFLPERTLAHELKSLHLVFSPKDIVTILTRNAALTAGRGDELGTLEAGKLADIVIVDGDPLADLFDLLNVDMVIKEGAIVLDAGEEASAE